MLIQYFTLAVLIALVLSGPYIIYDFTYGRRKVRSSLTTDDIKNILGAYAKTLHSKSHRLTKKAKRDIKNRVFEKINA